MIAAAAILGVIERDIRVFEQLLRVGGVVRIHTDADARGDGQADPVDLQRNGECRADALRDAVDELRIRQQGGHDDKLIAAHAYDDVVRSDRGTQTPRSGRKQLVPAAVAERVVDVLEMIEVHVQQRKARVVAARSHQQPRQQALQMQAVRQAREPIAPCEAGELPLVIDPLPLREGACAPATVEERDQQHNHEREARKQRRHDPGDRAFADLQGRPGNGRGEHRERTAFEVAEQHVAAENGGISGLHEQVGSGREASELSVGSIIQRQLRRHTLHLGGPGSRSQPVAHRSRHAGRGLALLIEKRHAHG